MSSLFDQLVNNLIDEKETRIGAAKQRQAKVFVPPILSTPRALMNPDSFFEGIQNFERKLKVTNTKRTAGPYEICNLIVKKLENEGKTNNEESINLIRGKIPESDDLL